MPVTDAAPAWRRFCERYLTAVQEVSGSLPITEHDPATRSPCEVGEPDEHGTVMWRPVSRRPRSDLAAVQRQALILDAQLTPQEFLEQLEADRVVASGDAAEIGDACADGALLARAGAAQHRTAAGKAARKSHTGFARRSRGETGGNERRHLRR